jgi:nicotinamidase-related amidase
MDYDGAPEPADLDLPWAESVGLVIDVQSSAVTTPGQLSMTACRQTVIPRTCLLDVFRRHGIEGFFARIACHTKDGRGRFLSWKMPVGNDLLLAKDEKACQPVPQVAPVDDEIVMTKMTDSALTGTNLRLIPHNLGVGTLFHRPVRVFDDAQPRR